MTATVAEHDLGPTPNGAAVAAVAQPLGILPVLPDLFAATRPAESLRTAVGLARRIFDCDGAGIVLTRHRGGSTATLASGGDAARADAMQAEYHQGPAFDAMHDRQPVVTSDLRFDSRWRFWSPKTADLGFRSVLSLALADGDPFGALTLYSRRPSFFRTESLAPELGFVQQVSIAVRVAVEREQLLQARDSRGIVGQAQGILMERYQMSADQAFAVLRRYSSHLNQKLRLIAERVIRDRSLPELDHLRRSLDGQVGA